MVVTNLKWTEAALKPHLEVVLKDNDEGKCSQQAEM